MTTGRMRLIWHEVLLRHVGNVGRIVCFSEDVIVGLVLDRPNIRGNGQPPLLRMIKKWIDIKDDTAKWPKPMNHDFTNAKFRISHDRLVLCLEHVTATGNIIGQKIADSEAAAWRLGKFASIR